MQIDQRLRIPSHYYVYSDPPDKSGEEILHFISSNRRIRMRGRFFREFVQYVVPLLNGDHTLEQISAKVRDVFADDDLRTCLELLGTQGLLEDAAASPVPIDLDSFLRPQTNFLHEVSQDSQGVQSALMASTVTVFGLNGFGATCAQALATMGVAAIRGIDSGDVSPSDPYYSPLYSRAAVGTPRAATLNQTLQGSALPGSFSAVNGPLETEDDVLAAVKGSHFIINCLDQGEIGLAYKLNRVCLAHDLPFTTVEAAGVEIILGPTVIPKRTACFLCYKMRSVACSDNPEAEFAFQSFLDRRRQDDSMRRANLAPGCNLAAQLAAMEAVKGLTSIGGVSAQGRIHVLNLLDMKLETHLVLRKPWCPACMPKWEPGEQA
jgi:adenylyltransferase/sulfurtransferase